MDWININDKHFVDITYETNEKYSWIENNNCPQEPFLVAINVFNNVNNESRWEKYLVVLSEPHGIETPEGDYIGWDVTDVQYWAIITNPNT